MENRISKKNISKNLNPEYLLPALAAISLIVSCIIVSPKKYFWNDELYSYYFLSDSSLSHMLVAFHDKINNTPILYFLVGWCWDKFFGSSELSLRLFSSLGMCVALIIVWITLRKTYEFWSTSIGTLGVFCTSQIILDQNAEARMYGLFLALCALGLYIYDDFARNQVLSKKMLLLNLCTHIAIIHTHLFGGFYSAAFLFSIIGRDIYFYNFRSRIYLTILLSWLSLIFYVPSFLVQSDAGIPRTWIPIPSLNDLINFLTLSSSTLLDLSVFTLVMIIAGLQFISFSYTKRSAQVTNSYLPNIKAEVSLLIFAFSFLLVPLCIWLISRTLKPIFWNRYMLPTAFSWSIIVTFISARLILSPTYIRFLNRLNRMRLKEILSVNTNLFLLIVLISILLLWPIIDAKKYPNYRENSLYIDNHQHINLPVVVQSSGLFLQQIHYSPENSKYFFILDWEAASNEYSGRFHTQEFKHLDALKRNYPNLFKNNILSTVEFLNRYDRFLVLDYPDYNRECPNEIFCPQWVEMRLLQNIEFQVTYLGRSGSSSLLLAEKKKAL